MIDQNIQGIFPKTSFSSCLRIMQILNVLQIQIRGHSFSRGGPGNFTREVGFELALERTGRQLA